MVIGNEAKSCSERERCVWQDIETIYLSKESNTGSFVMDAGSSNLNSP